MVYSSHIAHLAFSHYRVATTYLLSLIHTGEWCCSDKASNISWPGMASGVCSLCTGHITNPLRRRTADNKLQHIRAREQPVRENNGHCKVYLSLTACSVCCCAPLHYLCSSLPLIPSLIAIFAGFGFPPHCGCHFSIQVEHQNLLLSWSNFLLHPGMPHSLTLTHTVWGSKEALLFWGSTKGALLPCGSTKRCIVTVFVG